MKKYRAAIVGCGNISPMHANALDKISEVELVAVCDLNIQRAKETSEMYNCAYYLDYETMLEKEEIEVIHICLPHYLHEWAMEIAAKKKIHVFTEKPMSTSIKSAKRMIEIANKNQITFGVVFQNRYNIGAQTLKKLLESGSLGAVKAAKLQVTWNRTGNYYSSSDWKGTWDKEGGGVIIDQAIHTIDLVNWLVGGTPEYVQATIGNRFHSMIEVEDFAEGIIHYEEGYNISFMANNYYSYDAPVEIEIHTELAIAKIVGARLEISFFDERETIVKDIEASEYIQSGIAEKTYWGTGHITQIKEFYNSLAKKADILVTGLEALKTQIIIEHIYQSGKLNRTMKINYE